MAKSSQIPKEKGAGWTHGRCGKLRHRQVESFYANLAQGDSSCLCNFGKNTGPRVISMRSRCFQDFDEFATSIHGIESKMMLRHPKRRTWTINAVDVGDLEVQVGRLGSGNIAQGELQ